MARIKKKGKGNGNREGKRYEDTGKRRRQLKQEARQALVAANAP